MKSFKDHVRQALDEAGKEFHANLPRIGREAALRILIEQLKQKNAWHCWEAIWLTGDPKLENIKAREPHA